MNESEALLIVERGPVPTTQIPLQSDQMTVGRSAGNDLVLADPEVSRRHMRIIRRGDGLAIEDTGSTNGTFVNGQRISHLTLLQDGDAVDLGDTVRLRFMWLAESTPGTPVDLTDRPTQALSPPYQGSAEPVANPRPTAKPKPSAIPRPPAPASAHPPYSPDYMAHASPPAGGVATAPPEFIVDEPPRRGRSLLVGCGLLVALLLVCAGTFLILDAYDQGRLLYCGPLASFFEAILGPFGFSPICP